MSILLEVFNHLVLPPQLPGQREGDEIINQIENDLVNRLLRAVDKLETLFPSSDTWTSLRESLVVCQNLKECFEKNPLKAEFSKLQPFSAPIILYIVEQNAALVIRCRYVIDGF